ncbi:hypothetical protein QE418_000561 [Microbacterium testaceum]|uniref:hypothetical protein n=1 Tax=Microbacterium TaxID=33882 RepID=UPI00278A5AF4|nr:MULTISPECIES: hypothetical protein [Microbacterium]MDQ1111113.1 hypothetical protein [Microbacterium testaceum]MDR6098348.1 hypothetical protein [Microbacterium sp. SORGH_AS_0454]
MTTTPDTLRELAQRGVGFDMNPTMMFTTAESMYSQWHEYSTRLDREWRDRVAAAADALSTPPADDVREALTGDAPLTVTLHPDLLAEVYSLVRAAPATGHRRDLIAALDAAMTPDQAPEIPMFAGTLDALEALTIRSEVRPHGTVTDAERHAVADAIDNTAVITPRNDFLGGSTIANLLEVADAALEAAREVHP